MIDVVGIAGGAIFGWALSWRFYLVRMSKLAHDASLFDCVRMQTIVDLKNELSKFKYERDNKGRFLKRGMK